MEYEEEIKYLKAEIENLLLENSTMNVLIQDLHNQIILVKKLLTKVPCDTHNINTTAEHLDIPKFQFNELVRSNTNYITHYTARHKDFSSLVIVVLWKSKHPGPTLCFEGKPVLYFHHRIPDNNSFSDWRECQTQSLQQNHHILYSTADIDRSKYVKQIIKENQKGLFQNHSNLVAIRSSDLINGDFFIDLIVLCKNFIPVKDKICLPDNLQGIRTRVRSGWIEMCGLSERRYHRPLKPGAGIAVGPDALLNLDGDIYVPPVLGTLGGYYKSQGVTYGVTCAHCVRIDSTSLNLHPTGSSVFQPCAIGSIMNGAVCVPGLLEAYNKVKSTRGHKQAMHFMIEQLSDLPHFTTDLHSDAECGIIRGGILGPVNEGGVAVDVALIEIKEVVSPDLQIGDGQSSPILHREDFPIEVFEVYGRGAMSNDTMQAFVDPCQADIFFREVSPNGIGNLVFECIHANTETNWQPGDSGTWCWTSNGFLVGMGMAYAHIEGDHYCCILPMADVTMAINNLLS